MVRLLTSIASCAEFSCVIALLQGRSEKVHTPLSVRIKDMFGIKRKPRRSSRVTID